MPPAALNPAIPTQTVLRWPGLRTEYAWLPPHEGESHTKARQIGVSFSAHHGIVCEHGKRVYERDILNGAVWVTGEDGITWSRVREHTEALEMYPDFALLGRAAGVPVGQITVDAALGVGDAVVVGIASIFRRAHAANRYIGDLTASELAWRLATHLLDRFTDRRATPDNYVGLLDRRRLQRVFDHIEANLGDPIGIVDLADVYGVSPYHFARSFRRTTGTTPQQFVTMRRMVAAKEQLIATSRPIVEVAYGLGFRNLGHFRRTFRAHYGSLPSALRSAPQDSTLA